MKWQEGKLREENDERQDWKWPEESGLEWQKARRGGKQKRRAQELNIWRCEGRKRIRRKKRTQTETDYRRGECDACVQRLHGCTHTYVDMDYKTIMYRATKDLHSACLLLGLGSGCWACKQELFCFYQVGSPAGAHKHTHTVERKELDSHMIEFVCLADLLQEEPQIFILCLSVNIPLESFITDAGSIRLHK